MFSDEAADGQVVRVNFIRSIGTLVASWRALDWAVIDIWIGDAGNLIFENVEHVAV